MEFFVSNQKQSEFWNGEAGQRWVTFSDQLDQMLMPFARLILDEADISDQEDVLDIGCGGGALSILAANFGKSVLGVDISQPLIDLGWQRSKMMDSVDFARVNAASLALDKKRDVVLSRFGVMFFSDPVQAFANIKAQCKPKGRMVFACWQSPGKNDWAKAPLEAAMPFFKEMPTPPEANAPGPFAFSDESYVKDVLTKAGWTSVECQDWTHVIPLPGETAADAAAFMMEMGPLSNIIKDQNLDFPAVQAALTSKLEAAVHADGRVELQASVWIVKACAG